MKDQSMIICGLFVTNLGIQNYKNNNKELIHVITCLPPSPRGPASPFSPCIAVLKNILPSTQTNFTWD